jgi:hypothetical protein
MSVEYVTDLTEASSTEFRCKLSTMTCTDDDHGDAVSGVREPRRPIPPSLEGGVALKLPEAA